MLTAVVPDGAGGGWLCDLDERGTPAAGGPRRVPDLAAAVREREATAAPRWLWTSTAAVYPRLLADGVRVGRCHDLELTEALLLASAGRWGEPRSLAAVLARRAGAPAPPDPPPAPPRPPGDPQQRLFDVVPEVSARTATDLVTAYADQCQRIAATAAPERFRLLVAAESAGALAAAEMSHDGLPWRADVHDRVLTELLGPRPPAGAAPRRLAELAVAIAEALQAPGLHPESPAELRRAFARVGIPLRDTRAWSLREVDHPAVPLVLRYKELYRLWTAHGWSWCDTWVRDGRFRPEYVPYGVVSGRWATRGGGALQIPKVIRRAVVADDGWRLVVADAGQLEPRVLAAVSGDPGLAAAAGTGDLYAALAEESFDGDRARAKLALLGAMYGQTGGSALPAIAVLRRRYPAAWRFVEEAARVGESGGLVRSWLGRTCPPATTTWQDPESGEPGERSWTDPASRPDAAARSRGRFTRNFVIQATAAEWALTLLALLRTALAGRAAHLVFFQHDEVLVHCPVEEADAVVAAVHEAATEAGRMLFGPGPVRFPLDVAVVTCYADA
ncbi:MAG: bifunctional 3'-5' exonuclease/DNA polymerase [Micromonosporaceae bacterium]